MSKSPALKLPALPKLNVNTTPTAALASGSSAGVSIAAAAASATASASTSAAPLTGPDGTPIFKRSWDPVFNKKGQHLSGKRKPLPKPDSLSGKAYACYKKYADKYDAIVNSFHDEFTQQAREDAEQAERDRIAAIQPPSIPESPRILASLEDLIDVCRSHINARKEKRVRKLIKDNEFDVNAKSRMYGGWTALIAASRSGAYRTVRALCDDYGADVNLTEKHGWTALIHAAHKGHLRVVQYLCANHKADRLIRCKGRGWNALQYARKAQHMEVSLYLSGDTPAQTPRLMPYEGDISLRSVLYPLRRQRMIEAAQQRAICWCANLSERCKKCAIRERDDTERREDEERRQFLAFKQEELERRKNMWAGMGLKNKARQKKLWGGVSSDDDDSSSSSSSDSGDDMYSYD